MKTCISTIKKLSSCIMMLLGAGILNTAFSQSTKIRGFVDATSSYYKEKVSFGLGEQDLFITSELNDRFTFLGESVFKYDKASSTEFSVGIERIVLKYNYYRNHNIIIGKIHSPINYWNDTYHHGRVFFPTIERPLLFSSSIIPLHTTGLSIQGHDLGALKFGYDLVVGNGLGASEIGDNDKRKSVIAAVHIKPADRLRIGASVYNDMIAKGASVHGMIAKQQINQNLFSGSVSYFGKKFEVLAEGTMAMNKTDSTGTKQASAVYVYAGYKIKEKIIPYVRFDNLEYQTGELFYMPDNTMAMLAGIRYQINYLAVVKLEFRNQHTHMTGTTNKFNAQFAIGF